MISPGATVMYLELSPDWRLRRFADSSGVIYNSFTGQLHALPETPALLLEILSGGKTTESVLCKKLAACSGECDALALETDSKQHLVTLIELGVISTFAEHSSDCAVDPAPFPN